MTVVPRFQPGVSMAHANATVATTLQQHLHTLLLNLQGRAFFKNGRSRLETTTEVRTEQKARTEANLKENIIRFQIGMANDPHTSEHVLSLLASSEHMEVVVRVADHPRCPESLLQKLAAHTNVDVRCSLAQNPSLTKDVMLSLATDMAASVRYTLAESYTTNDEVLALLSEDESPYVACRAMQTLSRKSAEVTT